MRTMAITLDHQEVLETCAHCMQEHLVSRGSLYENERPIALHLAGLHTCDGHPVAVLAIALLAESRGGPLAVFLRAWASDDQVEMTFVDSSSSPWSKHKYLGRMLTADEARRDNQRSQFLHFAEHVLNDNPIVRAYLESTPRTAGPREEG